MDKGTSYRTISFFSVIADTGEEPSSLHNSKHIKHMHAINPDTKHGYKTQHSTVTALQTLNNNCLKSNIQ